MFLLSFLSPSLLIEPWDVEYVSAVLFCFILDIMLCCLWKKKKIVDNKKKRCNLILFTWNKPVPWAGLSLWTCCYDNKSRMSFEEPTNPRSSEIVNHQIQLTELVTYEERTSPVNIIVCVYVLCYLAPRFLVFSLVMENRGFHQIVVKNGSLLKAFNTMHISDFWWSDMFSPTYQQIIAEQRWVQKVFNLCQHVSCVVWSTDSHIGQ